MPICFFTYQRSYPLRICLSETANYPFYPQVIVSGISFREKDQIFSCINSFSFMVTRLPSQNFVTYLLTYLLTLSMVQDIILKADCHSACQKYLALLWNPKVHHRIHKSLPLDRGFQSRPLESWVYVCIFLCCVLSCIGRGLTMGRSPVQGDLQKCLKHS
jgi:hypothetical protein